MCIYCGTTKYRKIYEQHYGKISKDELGRTYDIHHIDGNHSNNDPSNLVALSMQQHYDIHHAQGDWHACQMLAPRLKMSAEQISFLAREAQMKKVLDGTHHWLRRPDGTSNASDQVKAGTHNFLSGEIQRKTHKKNLENGTHNLLKRVDGSSIGCDATHKNIQNGTHLFIIDNPSLRRVANGTHNFIGGTLQRERYNQGRHPAQLKMTCIHCGIVCSKTNHTRFHGQNCKTVKERVTPNGPKGKKWWNNGQVSKMAHICPPGFQAGRLKKQLD